jgi:hypothetical protein
MTRAEIRTAIWRSLNDPSGVFLPAAQANTVIEEAQETLAELGTPIRRRVGIPVRAYWTYYRLSPYAPDAIMPARLYSTANAQPLDPWTITELDEYDINWERTTGDPWIWFPRGWDRFGIYPKPVTSRGVLWVDYLAWPQEFLHDAGVPEFPSEHHEILVQYGLYDGLIRGGEVQEAMKVWAALTRMAGKAQPLLTVRTPDREHQHRGGNGHGSGNS